MRLDLTAVEGSSGPPGLVTLPRLSPFVTLDIELAKGVAGCVICDRPIQKGLSRVKVTIDFKAVIASFQPTDGHSSESYYFHPECLGDRIRPEIPRMGTDCWDCGAPAPGPNAGAGARHPHDCFTTSKFALAKLCSKCAEKPKWLRCNLCSTFYPQHMIDTYVGLLSAAGVTDAPDVTACPTCAKRQGLTSVSEWNVTRSKEEAERMEAKLEFKRTRAMVKETFLDG
jgi:hypothetical protein